MKIIVVLLTVLLAQSSFAGGVGFTCLNPKSTVVETFKLTNQTTDLSPSDVISVEGINNSCSNRPVTSNVTSIKVSVKSVRAIIDPTGRVGIITDDGLPLVINVFAEKISDQGFEILIRPRSLTTATFSQLKSALERGEVSLGLTLNPYNLKTVLVSKN